MTLRFGAPWSTSLTLTSLFVVGVLALVLATGATVAAVILGATVALAGYYAVLGYAVEPGALVVYRPGRETRIDLGGLRSAEVDPDAMRWSVRTFGVGGPFAFVGRYRNRRTGPFMAYATDRDRSVVLRWEGRTVVVTPDDPETFVTAVEAAARRDEL